MTRVALLSLAALAVVLALALGYVVEHAVEFVWAPVVAAVALESVLVFVAILFRPERSLPFLCDPAVLFVIFQAQFFIIGALSLPFTTAFAETPLSPRIVALTVMAFIGLLAMFLVGYRLPVGVALANVLPVFETGRTRLPGRWAESGLLVLGFAACAVYVIRQQGIVAMLNRGYGAPSGSAIFIAPFLLLVLVTFLLGWRVFDSPRARRGTWMVFAAVLTFEVAYWGFLMGTRKYLFYLFFGLTAIFVLRRGTRAIPRFVLPTVAILLVCYLSVWGTVRGRPIATYFQEHSDAHYGRLNSFSSGYFESVAGPFGTACLTLQLFPEVEPFRYGQTLLVALFSPIPRSIWPNKPIGLGKELTWYLGSYYSGSYDPTQGLSITPTLVGDFYANLGVFGILLGGLACGIGCRTVAAYAVKGMKNGLQLRTARVLIPAVFLAGLVEVRGDGASVTLFYMYTLLPLLGLLTFFSFDHPPDAAEPEHAGPAEV